MALSQKRKKGGAEDYLGGANLDKLIDQHLASNWHVVDNVKFSEAQKKLQAMFIKTKKNCPQKEINGVSVNFQGNNLFIDSNPLVNHKWQVHYHNLQERKFIIDNVEALAEYVQHCREKRKSSDIAFLNMNSVLVKRARKIIVSLHGLNNAKTLGFNVPRELHVSINGIEISLNSPHYEAAYFEVNKDRLSWPYAGNHGKDETKVLLAGVWTEAEELFREKIEELKSEVLSHNQRMVEKLKVDLAEQLLMARWKINREVRLRLSTTKIIKKGGFPICQRKKLLKPALYAGRI